MRWVLVFLAMVLAPAFALAQPAGPSAPSDAPAAAPAAAPSIASKCQRLPKDGKYNITLKRDAELGDLVDWMMSVSCQKFIWAPGLRTKKVNVVAPEPVTLSEAYAAFFAALQTIGATVEPAGDYYKIVETTALTGADLPVYGPGAKVPNDDRYVTKVWRPAPQRRDESVALLTGLVTSSGTVTLIGDVVVMTETGARIRRLERLLIDLESEAAPQQRIHLYGVRHADPTSLIDVVKNVFSEAAASTAQAPTPPSSQTNQRGKKKPRRAAQSAEPNVMADERTGTLIIVASDEQFGPIRRLIEELDRETGVGQGTLHVIELKHADASEVEAVLTKLAGGASSTDKGGRKGSAPSVGSAVTGDVRVTAHQPSGTLIVSASAADFTALKRVVDRIDRVRRQLYIEVYLLEVRSDHGTDVGAGGHFGKQGSNGGLGFVSSSPGGVNAVQPDSAALLGGLGAGILGPTIPGSASLLGLGRDIPAFGVVLQAMETLEDVNIVAEPHLYAAENEEAFVEFGETVPVRGATTTVPGSTTATLNSVVDKDITLSLKVIPHVADDNTLSLDVELEDKQIGARDADLESYATLKRRLDLKKIIARPGQPVVLGGLTREIEKISTGQVPGIGSVPVLGWLFKRRQKEKFKVSLLMIMVPHLIDSPDDARRVHARRLRERMEFIERETAFKRKDLDTHVNYRKKSGLLSTVNLAATRQQHDAQVADEARRELADDRLDTSLDL